MNNQLKRSFEIIEYLAKQGPSEIENIHKHTLIPRSTVFKLLTSLEDLGYAFKANEKAQVNSWYLTLKLLKISRLILSRLDFKNEVRDILIKLSKEVNEIVQLGIYHDKKIMYIDVVKKPESLISYAGIGTELDINISAAGMVAASALEKEELEDLLNNTVFPKKTIYTLNKPIEIKKEIEKISSNGYAFDDQQYAIGIRCLAAPIYNFEDKVIGAINITGHISTITDEAIDFLKDRLLKAASEASIRMGYEKSIRN